MAITLPYEFDTSGVVKLILRGVLGLLLVVLVGVLYSLLVSHSIAAAIKLLLVTAVATYFGSLFLRNLTGSLGTITADAVVVQPGLCRQCPSASARVSLLGLPRRTAHYRTAEWSLWR